MHVKSVHIASDDAHTRAWVREAVTGLDLRVSEGGSADLVSALASGGVDLAVVDGGHAPEALLQKVERAAADGAEVSALAIVEPDALGSLRLPVRLPCDFLVRGASADFISLK